MSAAFCEDPCFSSDSAPWIWFSCACIRSVRCAGDTPAWWMRARATSWRPTSLTPTTRQSGRSFNCSRRVPWNKTRLALLVALTSYDTCCSPVFNFSLFSTLLSLVFFLFLCVTDFVSLSLSLSLVLSIGHRLDAHEPDPVFATAAIRPCIARTCTTELGYMALYVATFPFPLEELR